MVNQCSPHEHLSAPPPWESLSTHPDIGDRWAYYIRDSRKKDLKKIWKWAKGSTAQQVLWIHGPGHIGKSTLARRLRDELWSKDRLAAAVFLSHFGSDSKSTEQVIRLIGTEIGRVHEETIPTLTKAISRVVPPVILLKLLVHDPIRLLKLRHPLIVILDAIEQCDSYSQLIEHLSLLRLDTSVVKFIIFGRTMPPDSGQKDTMTRNYPLLPASTSVVVEYLTAHFDLINWGNGNKPTAEDTLKLAAMADGLFPKVDEVVSISHDVPQSDSTDISQRIYDLARSEEARLEYSGNAQELVHWIFFDWLALALRPPGHVDRGLSLERLARILLKRRQISGSEVHLGEPVALCKEFLENNSEGHPRRGHVLNTLGNALNDRFLKSQSTEHLEEAIRLHREALGLRPPGHEDRGYSCFGLAFALHDRYGKDRSDGDLDEAILLGREVVSLRPQGHQLRFFAVNILRIYFEDRFKANGAIEDLQEAIPLAEEAITICPKDSRHRLTLPGKLTYYKAELARLQASSTPSEASD